MNLEQLWNEYNKDPTEENAERLCDRVQAFAKIVLRNFNLRYLSHSYEDLLQQAFVCFLSILDDYERGRSLESFFLVSFRNYIIKDVLRGNLQYLTQGSGTDDIISSNPSILEILICGENEEEFRRDMETLFSSTVESYLFQEHISKGKVDYRKIVKGDRGNIEKRARECGDTRTTQQIIIDSLEKLKEYFLEKYPKLRETKEVIDD